MRTRLKEKYSQMKMLHGWSEDEIALAAVFKPFEKKNNFTKQFKGMCRSCGKVGHKAPDCWEKEEYKSKRPNSYNSGNSNGGNSGGNHNSNNNHNVGRFSGKCLKCGKMGHKSFQCRSSGNEEQANNARKIEELKLLYTLCQFFSCIFYNDEKPHSLIYYLEKTYLLPFLHHNKYILVF